MADSVEPLSAALSQASEGTLHLDLSSSSLESETKRFKSEHYETEPPLEERLVGVLCCVVCLDLSNLTFYQCSNGHLMCNSCLSHLLADARIKDENATCPQCRCEIKKDACIRNLAVEKAISELPILCAHCNKQMPRSAVLNHEKNLCLDRVVPCSYAKLGCLWTGKFNGLQIHEATCHVSKTSGQDILPAVQQAFHAKDKEVSIFKSIYELLSCERLSHFDLQLRPFRTDEYIPKLYYESNKFTAHGYQWAMKARVNESQNSNPLHSVTRTLSYQLSLKSKLGSGPIALSFVATKGPFGETHISPVIYDFEFTAETPESTYRELPLPGSAECNKLLAAKIINLRLIIAQVTK